MYCVYLTVYRGNKLPPFYIGSSSVERIKSGYHGSVSSKKWKEIWKAEIKNNPHLFESKIICTFNTRQEALDKEYKLQLLLSILNPITNNMYINQAYANINGFFGRKIKGKDHHNFGKSMSEKQKEQLSKANIGSNNPFYGKHHTEESKRKHSIALMGHTYNTGNKNPAFGKIWINNGNINKRIPSGDIIPAGWNAGLLRNKFLLFKEIK